jgi:hypothetical protein
MDGLDTGLYGGWCMDGGFVGLPYGGRFVIPAACPSSEHDHLPGDSNYASERALDRLVAAVRQRHPEIFIFHARPVMDLGVWSCRNADGVFALNSECIGLHQRGTFRLAQHHPASNRATDGAYGQTVRWPVPGESAVVLDIRPYQQEVCK